MMPSHRFHSIQLTVREQITIEDFQDGWWRCCLKIFKMADMEAILDIGTEWFQHFLLSIWPQCLPPSLGSIWLRVREQMWFQDFQDGCPGTFKQFWISMSLQCFPLSFWSIQLMVWEEMTFEEFQYGCHLGYQNGTIFAILNLYVTPMPPIKF